MDILAPLPDTHAGRHTKWLWSRILDGEAGVPPLDASELAGYFAPLVFDTVPAADLAAHYAQLGSTLSRVTQVLEETSSGLCYSALLAIPDFWMRYTCLAQDTPPHLLTGAAFSQALEPGTYSDRRIRREGRDVRIRDFGGTGPLVLLWHGAGCDLTCWEALVPHLAGFHVVAQDLPGHGQSRLPVFTIRDALADADVVTAEIDEGPPIVVGHSLGGYLGLRYASTRRCSAWIGLDGPFAMGYPWEQDDPGLSESVVQISREIRAIDVVSNLAVLSCPSMLMLCTIAANPLDELLVTTRRKLEKHIAQRHPEIRIDWVPAVHDTILFLQAKEIATAIRALLPS
jgi:pimeloyl-ACP methyl ester carboxylesterase